MNLWETKGDLCSDGFLAGGIHRGKVSDSSAHEGASSDDSLLEDPFSLHYVLHVKYFSVFISFEKIHKRISLASVHAIVKQKRGTQQSIRSTKPGWNLSSSIEWL